MRHSVTVTGLILLFFLAFLCRDARGDTDFQILADSRYIHTDEAGTWLDASMGKYRYGGDETEQKNLFRISQLALLWRSSTPGESLSFKVQLNIDAEPHGALEESRFQLIESSLLYQPWQTASSRFRIRGGLFFPPVSMENTDAAWTSSYTITPSAINSWIGEEVRVTGAELRWSYLWDPCELSATASMFGWNDPAGSLLSWRGWALHDRLTGFSEKVPLAPLPGFQPGNPLAKQPEFVDPFREVDDRPGYYWAVQFRDRRYYEARVLRYRNRGDQTVFDGEQYAWDTTFWSFGGTVDLPHEWTIIAQSLSGDTYMGRAPLVDNYYRSWFALLSKQFSGNRLTARYDSFRVEDEDVLQTEDNNNEDGNAWTAAYLRDFGANWRVAAEYIRIHSNRPARETLHLPAVRTEHQFQISIRLLLSVI